ncbi:hypothetical protein [Streptomyces smyrnaeus]|uniref:hypothetical protein n=1 Tax=Streptomyces smyrnaeus TaxID=1387713 RepID=UPI003401A0AD
MTAGADLRLLRAAVFAAVCVTVSAAGHLLAADTVLPFGTLALGFGCVFVVAVALAGRERSLPGIAGLLALGQVVLHLVFSMGAGGQHSTAAAGSAVGAGSGPDSGGLQALAGKLLCNDSAAGMSDAEARRVVVRAGLDPQTATSGGTGAGGAAEHAAHAGHQAAAAPFPDSPLDCLREAARAAAGMCEIPMLLGHLCAALLLGWMLRRGEAALWRLVRLSADAAAAAEELVAALALRTALALVRALHTGLLPRAVVRVRLDRPDDETAPRPLLLQHSVHRRGPPAQQADAFALAA